MRVRLALAALLVAGLALAAGCGGGSSSGGGGGGSSSVKLPQKIGPLEGQLNLIAWQGYTEPDVVKPFEAQTGCQVHVKYGQTSSEMYSFMQSGNYDGVSASGNASNRLIAAGLVSPINPALITDFKDISPQLQGPPNNTVNGVHYGVSYQWGANVLMYNTKVVKPAPTSWGVIFDGTSYKGKVDAYDDAIYIADAALYLKSTDPSLIARRRTDRSYDEIAKLRRGLLACRESAHQPRRNIIEWHKDVRSPSARRSFQP